MTNPVSGVDQEVERRNRATAEARDALVSALERWAIQGQPYPLLSWNVRSALCALDDAVGGQIARMARAARMGLHA